MQATSEPITAAQAVTLDGLLRERVRRSPGVAAYHAYDRASRSWTTATWGEVGEAVGRWRGALAAEGLEPGERVALALRNSREWVYFDQAALALGLVVVPLYTDDRPDNQAFVLADAGVRVLLVPDLAYWHRLTPYLEELPDLRRVVVLEEGRGQVRDAGRDGRVVPLADWLGSEAARLEGREGHAEDLATIVYTSGTTGRPKGVMLSHANILGVAGAALEVVECYREDLFLSFLPLSHTLERTVGYYLPIMTGASVAYARSVQQLAEDLAQMRPTVMVAVPRVFERFYARVQQGVARQPPLARRLFALAAEIGWRRFEQRQGRGGWSPGLLLWPLLDAKVARPVRERLGGRLRVAISGGAALGFPVARLFLGLGVPILQGYGLTETSPVVSVNPPEDNDAHSVGKALPGIEVRIGESQELLVRGPGVMLGYWNRPRASAEVIDPQGWLHTGDQARIEDGHIHITGRIKDILVLSNGEKVPPGDMEGAITLDDLFEQALVIGEGQAFLSALLVLNREAWARLARELGVDPEAADSLRGPAVHSAVLARIAGLLKDFPGYAKVRRVVLSLEPWTVDHGLMTPTLKVRRNKVVEHYAADIERIYALGPAGRAA